MRQEEELYRSKLDRDRIEKCARWLQSIPRADIAALGQTSELYDFLRAFERLEQAHRRNRSIMDLDDDRDAPGFLQQADDVVLRIFDFLECHSLIKMSLTCSRLRELAHTCAKQRTQHIASTRQLNHVMKLLRAKEHVEGAGRNRPHDFHVCVPILGLRQRVLVTETGDPEYNGVYYCTGSNGNGFVFTKPRDYESRISGQITTTNGRMTPATAEVDDFGLIQERQDQDWVSNWDEARQPGKLLRCIISKRFSNETILWYMSKEVETTSPDVNNRGISTPEVTQVFSYWAHLMVVGEASPAMCCYPSLTSVLSRNGEGGWQPLSSTRLTHPPTVELIMD